MFIRLYSDLHLEFDNPFTIPYITEDYNDTVLVLAGDIGVGTGACDWIKEVAPKFKAVIYVLGNHEYYGHTLGQVYIDVRGILKHLPNVWVLDDSSCKIDDVLFIGSTLWTSYNYNNPMDMLIAQRGMHDFNVIKDSNNVTLIPSALYDRHKYSVGYIDERLKIAQQNAKVREMVVITHHLPSLQCIPKEYKYSQLNASYASDLEYLMYTYRPKYWFYGHTHKTVAVTFDETLAINNPFGYYQSEENPNFDPKFRVEV